MKARNILIASTAAMLLLSGAVTVRADEMSAGKQVSCFGVNSCKGHGSCKTAQNDCKGKNACKGQGNMMMSAEDCNAKGGKVVESPK
ncbi:MAG TPA: hypothetical protein VJX23_09895 [Candidatus Binataceae bacterium]|nr:hypothetical protein [Candidatus Binataceae bacterium]